ncbi:MAG: hypothetical protein GWP67_00605 [Gammaproteobacteria bacterium]|nr:hypothetical protein [Gammaproteobacteria bacterium]
MHQTKKKSVSAQKSPLLWLMLLGPLGACGAPSEAEVEVDAALPPPARTCGEHGFATASLFGSIEAEIKWSADDMDCENMRRPNGEGVRMRFAGDLSGERFAIIIALPGLQPGDSGVEVPSNVTATVEGSGRFFSTPNLDSCWTEVSSQSTLADDDGAHSITGTLFCVAPLGEINGDAAISIPEFSFSAIVNWDEK